MAGKKILIDNHLFDSQFESQVYTLLKKANLKIKLQPNFVLFEPFEYLDINNKIHKVRDMEYTGDFLVNDFIVIEVKGFQRSDYMMRKKLFLMKYHTQYKFIQINNLKEAEEVIKEILCK